MGFSCLGHRAVVILVIRFLASVPWAD